MKNIDFFQLTCYSWLMVMLYWFFAGMHTKITIRKEASANRILYVVLMVTAFALVYEPRLRTVFLGEKFMMPNVYTKLSGLAIHLSGIGLAIAGRWKLGSNWSGRVTVKRDHELIQTGPYALTRHPIYSGILFGLTGVVILQGEVRGIIALLFLFVALHMKLSKEEKFMRQVFPRYADYAKKTKKIIPLVY